MGSRPAEIGQHAIAKILSDIAPLAPYCLSYGTAIGRHDLPQVLRVEPGRKCRRARQIAEEHCELPSFGGIVFCGGWGRLRPQQLCDGLRHKPRVFASQSGKSAEQAAAVAYG